MRLLFPLESAKNDKLLRKSYELSLLDLSLFEAPMLDIYWESKYVYDTLENSIILHCYHPPSRLWTIGYLSLQSFYVSLFQQNND